jgi:glucose-1-phosphate thymidylyltransferase
MKGLVLCGGYGTRLRPITHTSQKQLIPVANKPIVFYAIEDLVEAGTREIGIVVGPNREQVKEAIGDGSRWGVHIEYIPQEEPRGLAHAVLISEEFLGNEDFIMYLGDNILRGGITHFVSEFKDSPCSASILLTKVSDPRLFGVAVLDEGDNVRYLVEKPKDPPSNLALVGIYAFKPAIFEAVKSIKPSWRNELEITEAIQWLIEKHLFVKASLVSGWWKDTGKPEDLLEANRLILDELEGKSWDSPHIQGRIQMGKKTAIDDMSLLRGPAIIGEGCVIENSYVGPFTSIGNNVTLRNAHVENSIVLDECEIDTDAHILDSFLGRGCHLKKTARLPRGVRLFVGDSSIIEV